MDTGQRVGSQAEVQPGVFPNIETMSGDNMEMELSILEDRVYNTQSVLQPPPLSKF